MNQIRKNEKPIHILLVEDNKGDILLTKRAFKAAGITNEIDVARSGTEALQYLRKEGRPGSARFPDLILMDLNIPEKDGIEVLSEIKSDDLLRSIPVIVLSSSDAATDIKKSYYNYANSYMVKPLDITEFIDIVESIEGFWFSAAKLPPKAE